MISMDKKRSSLENALEILMLFDMEHAEYTISELAGKMGLGYSTIHRLTTTLMENGFLTRDSLTKKVRLGSSLLSFEKVFLSYYNICSLSKPILEKLGKDSGESAFLSILKENKIVCLQKVDNSGDAVIVEAPEGHALPIHATSSGQSILAYQSKQDIDKVISHGLSPYTVHTITNAKQLMERLNTIQKQGYAYCKEEMYDGFSSISAPVKSNEGKVIYSITIAGPTSRFTSYKLPELIKLVKEASLKLG